MGLSDMFKGKNKRTGTIGVILAVITVAQAARTLKNYIGERRKHK